MSAELPQSNVVAGWMKLFHPAGVLCSLPIEGDTSQGFDYAKAFRSVQAAILAGFTPNAPGLEAGEKREEVGYVLRREKQNQDKSTTPIIDLYSPHDAVKFKILSVYLNKDEDVSAFEAASGLTLDRLNNFPGTAAPERGANKQSDKFICKPARTFFVVLTANPKYDEQEAERCAANKETYKVPKRIFVRWEGEQRAEDKPAEMVKRDAPQPDPMSAEANGTKSDKPLDKTPGKLTVDDGEIGGWIKFLETDPTVEELNKRCPYMKNIKTERTRRVIWTAIRKYAEDPERAWEFDAERKVWVGPVEVEEPEDNGIRTGAPIPF